MTFSLHVLPTTKTSSIFSIPYTVVLVTLILIQFVGCFQLQSSTWDFAIVHRQEVTFSALGSGQRQVISIPAPISSIDQRLSKKNSTLNLRLNDTGTDGSSKQASTAKPPPPLWGGQSFKKLELDVERGLLFLTSYPWNLQSLVVFNITSNKTYSLVTTDYSAPISGLVYHNGWLYWTNEKAIWRMNTSNEITTWKPEAEPFYKSPDCTLNDLAIDAKTNNFFFLQMCEEDEGRKVYTIQLFNGTHSEGVRESNNELRALTTDASFLYWVDHPGDFSIQRVPLSNLNSKSQILYDGQRQVVNSVSIVGCSQNDDSFRESLLWASCNSKSVGQRDNFSLGGVANIKTLYFGRFCPRGLISRSFALKDWNSSCGKTVLSSSTTTTTTTRTTTTAPPSVNEKLPPLIPSFTTISPTTSTDSPTNNKSTSAPASSTTTTTTKSAIETKTTIITTSSSTEIPTTTNKLPTITTTISTNSNNKTTNITSNNNLIPAVLSAPVPQSNSVYHPSGGGEGGGEEKGRAVTGTLEIALIALSSSLLILVVILLLAVVFLYRKVTRLQQKPRIRRRVIVSRSRDNNVPSSSSMCELIDIENCCNMNECETPCYERLGSSNSSMHQDYKSEGKARTEDKERLIEK